MDEIRITESALSVADFAPIPAPDCGAEAWFVGKVRSHRDGREVVAIEYDVFAPLAIQVLSDIVMEARAKWGAQLRLRIAHRRGRLTVGEISVLIRAESPHRDEAFAACRFAIEEIKTRAPVWKKEIYENGSSEWVRGHALCQHGSSDSSRPGGR